MNVWDKKFYKDVQSEDPAFRIPHKELTRFIHLLKASNTENVLDLGCGTGRHVIALAKEGFAVSGLDVAEEAVKRTKQWLSSEGLSADVRVGDIYQSLPYGDSFFDGVISIKTLHHAMMSDIKKLISEVERVMRPGGILMIEVPKRDSRQRNDRDSYKEIERGTFVSSEGPEKGIPHHIFEDEEELKGLFCHFEVVRLSTTGGDQVGTPSIHFTMLARLKP